MGKRGPLPKSNEQRILEGNPSKRPLKKKARQPERGMPTCPLWLSPEARQEWQRVAPELFRLKLLTKLDGNILAAYCESYAQWRRTEELLARQGSVYVTPKGRLQTRPEVAVAELAGNLMKTFAAELGLTPTSRARMGSPTPYEEMDPMEALLRDI